MPDYPAAHKHYIAARIFVFPEDDIPNPGRQARVVRTGGELIEGCVEVTTFGGLEFDASIAFYGISRIWIGSSQSSDAIRYPLATAEHQFLKETSSIHHDLAATCVSVEESLTIQRYPFRFTLPFELVAPYGDVNPLYLNLPPTAKLGPSYYKTNDGKMFMQPLIAYQIRLVVSAGSAQGISDNWSYWFEREVEVRPLGSMAPPLHVADYSNEFRLQACASTYNKLLQRAKGSIQISGNEPAALNVTTLAPRASTMMFVDLQFEAESSSTQVDQPYEWECEVQTTLRSKTFFSTKKLARNATVTEACRRPYSDVRIEDVESETRQLNSLSWKQNHLSSTGTIRTDNGDLPWTTVLHIPISCSKWLLPNFTTEMAARRYSLVTQVRMRGIRHGPLAIEVPVQVIRESLGGERPECVYDGDLMDSLGQDVAHLSMDETFSDVVAKLPPPYCEAE